MKVTKRVYTFEFLTWRNVIALRVFIFFLTVIMSITHPVTNITNDQELIEFPFGTVEQFRLGIRSVTDLNHVVKSDYK